MALHFLRDADVRVAVISEGPWDEWLTRCKVTEGMEDLLVLPFQLFEQMAAVLASGDVVMKLLEPKVGYFPCHLKF